MKMKKEYIAPLMIIEAQTVNVDLFCTSKPLPSKAFFEVGVNNESYPYPISDEITVENGGEAGAKQRGLYSSYSSSEALW